MSELYIGLMSGTSLDHIDAVLANFTNQPNIISSYSEPIPQPLKKELLALAHDPQPHLAQTARLDNDMGQLFARVAKQLLANNQLSAADITAIGSHGQTVCHQPNAKPPFSIQIGDPNVIAAITGITTIADFRRRDIALGGQGAPLTPAFHNHIFHSNEENRAIVNIGGIANITLLYADSTQPLLGFDTGPGNVLLDAWIQQHHLQPYDTQGAWAASGVIEKTLLAELLDDPYFQKPAPKSTGREYFNLAWLNTYLQARLATIKAQHTQATLTALTAHSIATSIQQMLAPQSTVILCGGGIHNHYLCRLLKQQLPDYQVTSSDTLGMDPDYLEAIAFAWFAQQTLHKKAIDLMTITGAKKPTILGGVYYT